MEIIYRMMKVFRDYCGVINEESIRKNFVLIYEIIDEVIDYGHPQLVATEHVRNYTVSDPVMIETKKNDKGTIKKPSKWNIFSKTAPSNSVTRPMTNLNSLGGASKKKGKSDKNEIFVDIFEKLSVLFN
jgi:AP-4 complex subunit mu-1